MLRVFFFQAEDGIRDSSVTGVQTCALPILVVKSRADLSEEKRQYAQDHAPVGDFLAAMKALRPTAIIGVAAVGGTFTGEVLGEMARINERPIVFALSNPTSKSECTAEEAYRHTGGRALFACGSPYEPVKLDGRIFV